MRKALEGESENLTLQEHLIFFIETCLFDNDPLRTPGRITYATNLDIVADRFR